MTTITRLDKKHIPAIALIDLQSGHRISKKLKLPEHKKYVGTRFKKGHEIFFGYKEAGKSSKNELTGYMTIKPFFPGHKHCELYWLSVKKEHQGKGIGKTLMKYAEEWARKKGFRKICLYTDETNKKARGFYKHLGYKKINEFPEYYSFEKDNTAVLYGKKLK